MPADVQHFLTNFLPVVAVLCGVWLGSVFSPGGQ